MGLHDTQGSAVLICNIICNLLFFMHREHFSLKSPPFTSLFSYSLLPFFTVQDCTPWDIFFRPLPCLAPFVDVYLTCFIPFPLNFVEALGKWVNLYQFLWFLLQRTACPQVQPDPCRRLFKLPKSLRFAHLISSQCAGVVCKMPW